MKKIMEWLLIIWISVPIMMEAVQVFVNLENYKIAVGWYTNVIYRNNTYYYIAAALEILLVLLIFIEIKRIWMLWLGLGVIVSWHILKYFLAEEGRAISYYFLTYNFSVPVYFSILAALAAIGILLMYWTYYKKAKI